MRVTEITDRALYILSWLEQFDIWTESWMATEWEQDETGRRTWPATRLERDGSGTGTGWRPCFGWRLIWLGGRRQSRHRDGPSKKQVQPQNGREHHIAGEMRRKIEGAIGSAEAGTVWEECKSELWARWGAQMQAQHERKEKANCERDGERANVGGGWMATRMNWTQN